MKKNIFTIVVLLVVFLMQSCNNKTENKNEDVASASELQDLVIDLGNGETAIIPIAGGNFNFDDWEKIEDMEDFDTMAEKMKESLAANGEETLAN